jgi:uncharacterized protein YcaQ
VCLKSDREAGALRVNAAHVEPGAAGELKVVAAALAGELIAMAAWLGLERVEVGRRGKLGQVLRQAVAAG